VRAATPACRRRIELQTVTKNHHCDTSSIWSLARLCAYWRGAPPQVSETGQRDHENTRGYDQTTSCCDAPFELVDAGRSRPDAVRAKVTAATRVVSASSRSG
jgi:hypothetical protein